jgi:Tfp pilus assembly protein PilF
MKCALIALAALLALPGCGSSSRSVGKGGKLETPKLPPVKPEALKEFDAGMRAVRLGGPDALAKAEPRLLSATQIDSNLWEAWLNLGVVYFEDGEDDKAVDAFGKALDINPAATEARLGRAEAARRAGDSKLAEKDYQTLIRERPTVRLHYARLASLHRKKKKYEAGLEVLREALRQAGADTQIYVELALIYLGQGRFELAELVLRRAIAIDDKQPAVHNAIALVLLERGKDQAAFERFDYATSLDPKYVDARFNAASVLLDSGDFPRAKTMLEELIQQAPDDYDAKVALGLALRGIKDYKAAAKMWESVVRSAPSRSRSRGDALWNLAVLEADVKMEDASGKKALERYLSEAPRKHSKRKAAEERLKELGQ